ncbi:MAG: DUF2490 domain-containing protein [Candidatus Omnitrophica bacterium]|nr:DUF2490 domain-containing protein [Candidatus Omnitrophota bacterium]
MRKLIVLTIAIALFPFCSFSFDDGDFQYWNTSNVSKKINDDWKLSFEEEFRWGDNANNPYYNHSDLGVTYSGLVSWLDLGVNYRHIHEDKSSDWKVENRPHLNADLKWKLFDLAFSNRGRLEYRNREDADNYWRYRNKFSIKAPFKLTKLEIQPYIADEIFYDFDVETLNRNRFYGGFGLKIIKNLKGEVYYLWETTEKSDKWNDLHIFGTKLKVSF